MTDTTKKRRQWNQLYPNINEVIKKEQLVNERNK